MPSPYVAHAPRLARPMRMEPVFIRYTDSGCVTLSPWQPRVRQVRKQYLEELRGFRSEMTAAIDRLETFENQGEVSPHELMLTIQAVDKVGALLARVAACANGRRARSEAGMLFCVMCASTWFSCCAQAKPLIEVLQVLRVACDKPAR